MISIFISLSSAGVGMIENLACTRYPSVPKKMLGTQGYPNFQNDGYRLCRPLIFSGDYFLKFENSIGSGMRTYGSINSDFSPACNVQEL